MRDDASIVPYRWFAGWRQRIWRFPRRDEDIPPYSILVGCCHHILNHFVGNGLDRSASLIIQTSFLYGHTGTIPGKIPPKMFHVEHSGGIFCVFGG